MTLVLGTDYDGNLVLTRRIDEIVQPLQIDGRQLVDKHGTMPLARIVDDFEELGHQHGQRRSVHALSLWIIADADNFGGLRIVHLQ